MSRTRSEGGATVVREEAISKIAGERPAFKVPWGEDLCYLCPPLAESRAEDRGSQLNPHEETKAAHQEQLNVALNDL